MKRREGSRYEICVICGLDWNVPKDLRIRYPGYICLPLYWERKE